MLVPFGPKPEGTVPEVRFEDGFHDDFRRGLDHLVLYGRQPERPLLAVLLWDIGALHRPGPVVAPFKRFTYLQEEHFHAGVFNLTDGHLVYTSGSLVLPDNVPGFP